jgi:hypothetical protein
MPYVITTKRQTPFGRAGGQTIGGPVDVILSRRAVSTLEDARRALWDVLNEYEALPMQVGAPLREAGGTVGPLPDGTVIEVEQVKWSELARHADRAVPTGVVVGDLYRRDVIDAFNAKQTVA